MNLNYFNRNDRFTAKLCKTNSSYLSLEARPQDQGETWCEDPHRRATHCPRATKTIVVAATTLTRKAKVTSFTIEASVQTSSISLARAHPPSNNHSRAILLARDKQARSHGSTTVTRSRDSQRRLANGQAHMRTSASRTTTLSRFLDTSTKFLRTQASIRRHRIRTQCL